MRKAAFPDLTPVSVVIPVRNAASTLAACLGSITRQSHRSWECIIVDDGSTDATLEVAAQATSGDARFVVVATPHHGLITTLNEGLRRCRAPLIARMDGDDVMHHDRLEEQARALEQDATLSAVGCHVRIFPRRTMSPGLRGYERWLNSLQTPQDVVRDAFVECPIAHPTLMMRRDMAALGYRDCGWPEDYDLLLRALGAGMRIGLVPRRLLSWRDRPDSLSRTEARYGQDRFTACKARYLAAGFLREGDRYILWGYGGTGQALRRALAALKKYPAHIVEVKPTRIGKRIHGAPVIPPDVLPSVEAGPIVVSVAHEGPRAEIRGILASMGFVEGRDFVCAA